MLRAAIDLADRAGSRPDTASRLESIHAAYRHESKAPSPPIEQMLEEIERGYLAD